MKRLTISIPDDIAEAANTAVAAGQFASVSAYFAAASGKLGDWLTARTATDEIIADAGGIQDSDRARADDILDALEARQTARRGSAA